ncbi:serine/threonine-protein kinase pakG [Drosophila albomicans]|uniref:Serine/threonine-protein kinase pakG n=1 Tax=Drosophila albomicans TaxID=7291 RepID=A0A6P8YZN8_DROAB|nr:serine/threonine-protein kinase pakG [Drosophila albomicans]
MENQRKLQNNCNSSSNKNNTNNNSQNNGNNHRRGSRPSVGYLLFQYQSELTRRHAEPTRLSRTKIHIIDGLVSRTIRHLKHCSVEELQACKRELVYKEQLRDELRSQRSHRKHSSSSASASCRSRSPSSSAASRTSAQVATPPPIKPPSTPPKPRATQNQQTTTKVVIFGPEIFV